MSTGTIVFIGIILLIAAFVIYIKYFKKEPEYIELPEEKPIPPVEPEKPIDPPKEKFQYYTFEPVLFLGQTEDSKVYNIEIPNDGEDHSETIQRQINDVKSGSLLAPTIIRFPDHLTLTNGNPKDFVPKGTNAAIYFSDLKYFIVEGGNFYTSAPAHPWGGNVNEGRYSWRRHIRFKRCEDFKIIGTQVSGSNLIEGQLLGSTPENTPDFWKGGKDDGSFGGAPGYISYWEAEHAFDFLYCKRFVVEGVKVNGVWGDGICIGHGNEDFVIKDSYLRFTGRQGIAVYGSQRGLIDNVWIDKGRRASIDLEPNWSTDYVRKIEIKECGLHAVMTAIAALGMGEVSDINIYDNEYSGGHSIIFGDSQRKTRRKNIRFANNTRTNDFGSPSADIKFYMTDNILIEGNTIPLATSASKRFAQFEDCQGVELKNNISKGAEVILMKNSTVKTDKLELIEY